MKKCSNSHKGYSCQNNATTRNLIGEVCCESCMKTSNKAIRLHNQRLHRIGNEIDKFELFEDYSLFGDSIK